MSKTFNVRVTTRAKQNKVVENGDVLRVYVTCVPENGRANDAVIDLLSDYLKIAKSRIHIIKGLTARDKIITVQ